MVDTEQRLFAFGPFGVSVGEGPYGTFRWRKKNVTTIELTERCIRGISGGAFGFLGRRPSEGDLILRDPLRGDHLGPPHTAAGGPRPHAGARYHLPPGRAGP